MAVKIEDVKFGDEARDLVTGFTGIVTAKALYATGCNQVSMQPPVKDDGAFVDSRWFDIERIEVIAPGKRPIETSPSGGPRGAETAPAR